MNIDEVFTHQRLLILLYTSSGMDNIFTYKTNYKRYINLVIKSTYMIKKLHIKKPGHHLVVFKISIVSVYAG